MVGWDLTRIATRWVPPSLTTAVALSVAGALFIAVPAGASSAAPDLDPQYWSVEVDSSQNQQIYSARSAIDGDPDTFWHTAFSPSPHPHWMEIDLLRNAEVEGFRYQGRPDGVGVPNGRVGNWAFYVSEEPVPWSSLSPVATGTFPDDALEHEVTFPAAYGRYLTFVALSEAGNRGGWTTVAELNVMGRFRDVGLQAVVGSVPAWTPVVDDLSADGCTISATAGLQAIRERAWVHPACGSGGFDTGGLAPGDYAFEYEAAAGSTVHRGRVTITVRAPMQVFDSAWAIPLKASDQEIEAYFSYLESAGYSGLWISLVPTLWQGGLEAPNRHGHAFESFDSPNPLYLEHVDHILDAAAAHNLTANIVVAWAADWVGDRPEAKYLGDLSPAPIDETNGAAFGRTLADRWKGHPGLGAWVMGGDWWTPETEAATEPTWEAIVSGIRQAGAAEPITYHTGGFHSSWVLFADRDWVDFLSPETSHCLLPAKAQGALTALKAQFGKEVVASEMRYEDEPAQARGVSTWCYPEGPAVGLIGVDEIAADAMAAYDAGAAVYVYGHDTRWNWGNGLATLGKPGEAAALDIAGDGVLGGDTTAPTWNSGASVTGSATDSTVTLWWSEATDNSSVVLYRVEESGRGVVARAPGPSTTITHLSSGTTYAFSMQAVDAFGNATPGPQISITTLGEPPAVPAGDRPAMFDPDTGRWHLRDAAGSVRTFYYGMPGDVPLFGDWDGDGIDTPGMYRPANGFAYLTNTTPPDGGVGVGDPGLTFYFGIGGDQVVAGDWDGDGSDTLGIRRDGKMYLTNTNATSVSDREFFFGVPGDIAFGGNGGGDEPDSIFLYRPATGFTYYTTQVPTNGVAATTGSLFYGVPTDRFIVGDWNADGIDTVGVFRPSTGSLLLRNSNTTGGSDLSISFGEPGWLPVAGHF